MAVEPSAAVVSASEANRSFSSSRRALLARLSSQSASGPPRSWQRDELYD